MEILDTLVGVYEVPKRPPTDGYCFGGGRPVRFLNLDWFNGVAEMTEDLLREEVGRKQYATPGRKLLVLAPEHDICFMMQVPT